MALGVRTVVVGARRKEAVSDRHVTTGQFGAHLTHSAAQVGIDVCRVRPALLGNVRGTDGEHDVGFTEQRV
ncbi:hypothetical protein LQL77_32095, partial [Rhodococcus cerastii]|nr:hypothetical protein [Rhodococcus cerastii]